MREPAGHAASQTGPNPCAANRVSEPAPAGASADVSEATDSPRPPSPDRAPVVPSKILERSLRNSVKDAIWWSVMQGAGVSFVLPFIVLRGAGLSQIAALFALPAFFGALVQLAGANVADAVGRRNVLIVSGAVTQACCWIPIAAATFLPSDTAYWLLLGAYLVCIAAGSFPNPAWQSLMGDLVPEHRRGRYFGVRTALSGSAQVAALFTAGWWLSAAEAREIAWFGLSGRNFGFFVLFAVACATRFVSAAYLARVYEPPYRPQPSDHFSLLDFIRRAPRAHFGRFVFYCAINNAGLAFMTPFLSWYLLERLHFSAAALGAILATSLLTNYLAQPLWGRLLDHAGSKQVLVIGGIATMFVPLLLLFGNSFWYFVLVQAYDGLATAAYSNATGNYFYDVVTPPKRARCIAYYIFFLATGGLIGSFTAAGLGAVLPTPVTFAGVTLGDPFHWMLLGAAALRGVANLLLLGTFDEFRLKRPIFAVPRSE